MLYLLAMYPTFWGPIYSLVNRLERLGLLDRFVKYYNDAVIDMPTDYLEKMLKVEARVGSVQIRKYASIVAKHRQRATAWRMHLQGEQEITLPPYVEGATYSHFVCLVNDRKAWTEHWRSKGIQLGQLIEYCIPYMAAYSKGRKKELPVSLRYSKTTINFPLGG